MTQEYFCNVSEHGSHHSSITQGQTAEYRDSGLEEHKYMKYEENCFVFLPNILLWFNTLFTFFSSCTKVI